MPAGHRPIVVRIAAAAAVLLSFGAVGLSAREGTVSRALAGTDRSRADVGATSTTFRRDCAACRFVVRLDDAVAIGAIQFRVDYSQANVGFVGDGAAVACTKFVGDFAAFNDDADARVLDGAIVSVAGFDGPINLASCELETCFEGELAVFPTDASSPDLVAIFPLPSVSGSLRCGSGTTTTTLPEPVCGAPNTGLVPPVTSDVLLILRAAVGLDTCDPCVCDVDSNGTVDARDARRSLLASLELGDPLICPGC